MVGRLLSFWGPAYFQGRAASFRGVGSQIDCLASRGKSTFFTKAFCRETLRWLFRCARSWKIVMLGYLFFAICWPVLKIKTAAVKEEENKLSTTMISIYGMWTDLMTWVPLFPFLHVSGVSGFSNFDIPMGFFPRTRSQSLKIRWLFKSIWPFLWLSFAVDQYHFGFERSQKNYRQCILVEVTNNN